jgi:MFS family permease
LQRLNPSTVFLIKTAVVSLASSIMWTTYALYYVTTLGFNPLQLLLVGTALEVTMLLLEVPTGVVADAHSRRLSVIIGTLILGVAFVLEGLVPYVGHLVPFFGAVLIAEIIRGVGETFLSGAEEAWITDEVGPEHVGPLFMRAGQVSRVAGLAGIAASVALANLAPNLPFLVGGALYLLLVPFLLLVMPETAFVVRQREAGQSGWHVMKSLFSEGVSVVRGRPLLMALMAASLIGGAASEGFDRLWEAHFLVTFRLADVLTVTPATAFGIFAAAGSLVGIVVGHLGEKWLDLTEHRVVTGALLVTAALRTALLFVFALAPSLGLAAGGVLLFQAVGAIYYPVYGVWVNQQVGSRTRATVLSMLSQSNALGQTAGGPAVGWVGARFHLRASLTLAAALLAPLVGVYGWAMRRGGVVEDVA